MLGLASSTLALGLSPCTPAPWLTTTLVPGTEYTGSPTVILRTALEVVLLPSMAWHIGPVGLVVVGYFGLLCLEVSGYSGLLGLEVVGYSGLLGLELVGYSGLLGLEGVGYSGLPGSGSWL